MKEKLLSITLKAIQGATFEPDAYYQALEPLGPPASYAETLVDVFWLLWVRFEVGRGSESMNLVSAIKACWQDKRVSDRQLLQVLEPECLHTVGLLRDKALWEKKSVRYNTKLNYTIAKYNLLREDSEGYAKLVTLYNHFGSGAMQPGDLPSMARELHSLIGCFDLDPNRCLDLLLDAAAAQPLNAALLDVVELLKAEAVGQLLGFKLQGYQDPSRPPAPRSLFLVAAQLIASRRATLTELLAHMAPSDAAQAAAQKAAREALMRRVNDIGTINLGGGGAAGGGGGAGGVMELPATAAAAEREAAAREAAGKERDRGGKGGAAAAAAAAQPRAAGLSAAHFELDPAAAVGGLAAGPNPEHNQPLALLDALLELGSSSSGSSSSNGGSSNGGSSSSHCWEVALELHDRLVAEGASPAAAPAIGAALCRLLEAEVKPRYAALFPQGVLARHALSGEAAPAPLPGGAAAPAPAIGAAAAAAATATAAAAAASGVSGPALTPLALRLLAMLGPFVHRDVRLFTKVIRLVRYQLTNDIASGAAAAAGATAAAAAAAGTATPIPAAAAAAAAAGGRAGGARAAGGAAGSAAAGAAAPPPLPSLEELISGVLLPGVACWPVHLPLAGEVWECVRLLPVQARYRVYADYRELSQTQPLLQAAWRLATVETKKVLKRLVLPTDPQKKKEACRPHARMVAKVAHANPMPVMEAVVTQIEVYDNQIEVSLEALKYLSPLSYDVLTFVILSRLAVERDKVKEDGVNISSWLQGLARFTGAACRRFSDLDVGAVLQFLVTTLRAGDAFDLLVLQQIIVSMTGVRLEALLSEEQMDALSGGPELIAEAVVLDGGEADAALGMGRTATHKDLAKGRQRLLRALEDVEGRRPAGVAGAAAGGSGSGCSSALTLPLLILVAQQRSIIINHTDSKLVKFIATMYDRCQDTLLHLCEFLRLALPVEAYADMLPPPDVLRRDFGIDVEVVWHIYRPVMARLLDAAAPQPAEEGELEEGEEAGAAAAPSGGADAAAAAGGAPREEARVGDKTWAGVLRGLPACTGSGGGGGGGGGPGDVVDGSGLWSHVTPDMYATFWSLQLQDIYVPIKRYDKELGLVRDQLAALESNYLNYIRPGLQSSSAYVSNNLQQQYEAYKAEKAALQDKQSRLSAELESRRRHVDEVRSRLALQRTSFFHPRVNSALLQQKQQQQQQQQAAAAAAAKGGDDKAEEGEAPAGGADGEEAKERAAGAAGSSGGAAAPAGAGAGVGAAGAKVLAKSPYVPMSQEMLLPRILFGATDALYTARLLFLLLQLETRHFNVMALLDTFLRTCIPVLRSATEVEAHNFGCFLQEVYRTLVAWHRDEKLFLDECARKMPGSQNSFKPTPHVWFKHRMFVWHGALATTFRFSLESGDYTQMANALSVMSRMVPYWPGHSPAYTTFRTLVERVQKDDPREDLKTMARSYLIALNREADKPGRMLSQADYGGPTVAERRPAGAAPRGGAAGAPPASPAAAKAAAGARPAASAAAGGDSGGKSLNVAAKPFVPKSGGGGGAANGDGGGGAEGAAGEDGRGAARKRQRVEGPGSGGKGEGGSDKAADGGGGKGGGGGGGAGQASAAKKARTDAGGGGGDDTRSEAGGRAGSETSGRGGDRADGEGGKGGKEGKEHKEHKKAKDKDKDREKERKDKDKERKGDKEHKEEKDESRREEKERRREEKEREKAERAAGAAAGGGSTPAPAGDKAERGEGRAPSAERSRAGAAGGAADGGRERASRDRDADRDGGDVAVKRRRADGGKSEGGGVGGASPGHAARGSNTPDISRRNTTDADIEYDAAGFALPPAPGSRGGGGGAGGARAGGGAAPGGGLPPAPRAGGGGAGGGGSGGEPRRRAGR
ncbi:hypothetical protein CHLRE_12g507700v5 [Chlamydomonas reinhardtii]|uniref:THO complex subunit 2 n=1 Tax=Chlamydomonas reinhardtii TaxID=3055 RepID=A0A2K3D2S9_CHLRE|nr:uncharacterized protein CHLRE_12g507700v5 [Chlamydomonas reinhardtii]PNW74840.1 hypothetical protein CHLRE_12g507700v5 [Chlamydomonas reinhardtii]